MFKNCTRSSSVVTVVILLVGTCFGALTLAGCERKERVLDVQTPEGALQVDRNIDTGEVEVEVQDND
jgi:hypothetical protein